MELSSPMSRRARIISRIIAVTMLCFGMSTVYWEFISLKFTGSSSSTIFTMIISSISLTFGFLALYLVRKFWNRPDENDIKKLAWVGAFFIFNETGMFIILFKIYISPYLSEEYISWIYGFNIFVSLCVAGVGYMLIKIIISRILDVPIQKDWQKKRKTRKIYFAILAFILWLQLDAELMIPYGDLPRRSSLYGTIVVFGSMLAAIVFYYVCKAIFCKEKSGTKLPG